MSVYSIMDRSRPETDHDSLVKSGEKERMKSEQRTVGVPNLNRLVFGRDV